MRFWRPTTFIVSLALAGSAFSQTRTSEEAHQRLVATVLENFSKWDKNNDGTLDEAELTFVVENPETTGEAAAVAATLKVALVSKKAPKFPLWTKDYFQSADPTLTYLTTSLRRAEARLKNSANKAVFDPAGITLEGCKQGALGDCYIIAATGAVITRDPNLISHMIEPEVDKSAYKVSYADGLTVEVPGLTQGELAMGGATTGDGLWLRILEKAWGIRQIRTNTKHATTDEPIDIIGHGGSAKAALEVMTGHKAKGYRLGGGTRPASVELPELRTAIKTAFDTHHLVVAGTAKGVKVPGISSNHAYAITGYDPATDQIQIWNPHVNKFTPKGEPGLANGYPTMQGHFSMPLAEFRATFSGVSVETDEVKPAPSVKQ